MPSTPHGEAVGRVILEHLEAIWREPDEGIWEVRGEPHTSRIPRSWLGSRSIAPPTWRRALTARNSPRAGAGTPTKFAREVCARGFDEKLGSFVQFYGVAPARREPAANPARRLPAARPSACAGHAGSRRAPAHARERPRDPLRDRESGVDGLPPGEGAFLACSFWLVENYIQQGRWARRTRCSRIYWRFVTTSDLLAEEYDPRARRQLGNFPQAFSHIGLINTAVRFARAKQQLP